MPVYLEGKERWSLIKTEKFDKTRYENGSIFSEDDGRGFIRTNHLPKVKTKEGIQNIIRNNLNSRHNQVRG